MEGFMTIAELLQPEFDQEMAATRRALERVPDDKIGWKPHAKSFSMGALASHIVTMVPWTNDTMTRTELDLAKASMEEMTKVAKNRDELLSWFDANVASARDRAREIMLLMEGAMALMLIHGNREFAHAAATAAKALIRPELRRRSNPPA
jgi:hypothetical protein